MRRRGRRHQLADLQQLGWLPGRRVRDSDQPRDNIREQIVKTGNVQHGRLGVEVQTVTQALADSFKLEIARRRAGLEGGAGQRSGEGGAEAG